MRISDWSSDVCSSDLLSCTRNSAAPVRARARRLMPAALFLEAPVQPLRRADKILCPTRQGRVAPLLFFKKSRHVFRRCCEDRNSVVEGKRLSLRVDLGGRRSIKKKKQKKQNKQ